MGTELVIEAPRLEWDYVPKFAGNRKDKACKVRLRQPTNRVVDEALVIRDGTTQINRQAYIEYSVVKIEGLRCGEKEIKTAQDLIDAPDVLFPLFVELFMEIKGAIDVDEGDQGN